MQLYLCLIYLNNYVLFILLSLAVCSLSSLWITVYLQFTCAELVWSEFLTCLCESSLSAVLEAMSLKFTAPHSTTVAPASKEPLRLWNFFYKGLFASAQCHKEVQCDVWVRHLISLNVAIINNDISQKSNFNLRLSNTFLLSAAYKSLILTIAGGFFWALCQSHLLKLSVFWEEERAFLEARWAGRWGRQWEWSWMRSW